jgi:hypothetical protein
MVMITLMASHQRGEIAKTDLDALVCEIGSQSRHSILSREFFVDLTAYSSIAAGPGMVETLEDMHEACLVDMLELWDHLRGSEECYFGRCECGSCKCKACARGECACDNCERGHEESQGK